LLHPQNDTGARTVHVGQAQSDIQVTSVGHGLRRG
jgi:hypothetical protein